MKVPMKSTALAGHDIIEILLCCKARVMVYLLDSTTDNGRNQRFNYRFIPFIQDGELVTDPDKIQKNYMARRFKMDLISTLPLDLIVYFAFSNVPIVGELLGR